MSEARKTPADSPSIETGTASAGKNQARRVDPLHLDTAPIDKRIWITQRGDVRIYETTHGSAFWDLYVSLLQDDAFPPAHPDPFHWMEQNLGSTPPHPDDPRWDNEDNPGWQYNEFAISALGWIRASLSSTGGRIELDLQYDGKTAGRKALREAIRLVKACARHEAPVVVIVNDELPMDSALAIVNLLDDMPEPDRAG